MASVTEQTEKYISEHRSIKECLKKGLINYSSLARLVQKDLGTKAKKEAILIAARRYKQKIKNAPLEDKIIKLVENSNIDIKNNIIIYTLEKNIFPDSLVEIEKEIKHDKELFFAIEGTKTITLIIQKQNKELIEKKFKSNIINKKTDLALITISCKGIEETPGVVNYISGWFFDNSINIEEFMSCYNDTLVVINAEDVDKAIRFANVG
jgi:aspartokinase